MIFESPDYRSFLKLAVGRASSARGVKSQIAHFIGCQPAYFSQVLAGQVELTPEQAERLCSFWELSEIESEYFFNLVLLGRAGTHSLKRRLEKKLSGILELHKHELENRKSSSVQEPLRGSVYYSHWLHSAVHLLLTIPEYQKSLKLAEHLRKPETEILEILESLVQAGFAKKTATGWISSQVQIHASERNFFAELHHKNWRNQATEVRQTHMKSAIRYTSIHSLSRDDFQKVKAMVEKLIQDSRLTIESSPEQIGAGLLIDYFEI